MAVKRVQNVSLAQIPDLDGRISTCRDEIATVGVEGYFVDDVVAGIVVLDWFLASDVEDLDYFVGATRCYAGAIGVELDRAHSLVVVVESVNEALGGHIPHLNLGIFGAGSNEPGVGRKHGCVNPVSMCADGEHEPAINHLEALDILVI